MNAREAGQLLAILSAVDRREVDATTAQGWAWALNEVAFEHALEAARRAMNTGAYVDVNAIKGQLKSMRPRLEADVRSAKARGIVPESWPRTKPLTGELEAQLRAAQSAEWADTNDRPEEITPGAHQPDVGITMRSPE